jgi:alpha-tubulin suppressor-like RCC1 family protein
VQTCGPERTWWDCLDCPRTPGILGLAVGSKHLCAWLTDGSVRCAGDNVRGQLGIGSDVERSDPVTVPSLEDVVSVAAHGETTCALLADGMAKCWGIAIFGILGDGALEHEPCPMTTSGCSRVPVAVAGLSEAVRIGMGVMFACALLEDGSVWCWGDNSSCQLGTGVCPMLPCDSDSGSCSYSPVPVPVLGISDAVALSVSAYRACVVHADGTVSCWGPEPWPVIGVTDAVDVATSGGHSCAILRDRTLQCWGRNSHGQLGDGTTTFSGYYVPPQAVPGLRGVTSVTTGSTTCAMLDTGEPRCWGTAADSHWLVENGTIDPLLVPTPVWGIPRVTSLLAGKGVTCATLPAGSAACWGMGFPAVHVGYSHHAIVYPGYVPPAVPMPHLPPTEVDL